MTELSISGRRSERNWRLVEWAAVTISFVLLSGAIFPLLMIAPDGILDGAEAARLRNMALPCYALLLLLLARHPLLTARAGLASPLFLFLLVLPLVSVLWSVSGSITVRRSIGLLFSMALSYLLATRFSPRQQWLALGSTLTLLVGLSIVIGFAAPDLGRMPDDAAMRGLFINKNVFGWISAFTFVFGLAGLFDTLRRFRQLGMVQIAIGIAGGILSTSATSIVAVCISGMTCIFIREIARHDGLARVLAQLVLFVFVCLIGAGLTFGLLPLLDALGKDITLTGRVPLWELVDPEIAKRPVLGYGYGAFWTDANPVLWEIWAKIQWDAPHAHNGYRDLMLGLGFVGFVAFVLLALRAVFQGTELIGRAPADGWMWCVLAITTTLVLNLSETSILTQNDPIWIICSTAILTTSFRYSRARSRQTPCERLHVAAA